MKTDEQLKFDVESELRFDPEVNAALIGVTVDHGAVALLGTVDTYPQKWAAEKATKRVGGVRTVAQDLTVKVLGPHKRDDIDLAAAVQSALKWDVVVPNTVTARVEHAAVTLQGEVVWKYQRDAAEHAIRGLSGVITVFNDITLKAHPSVEEVEAKVSAALQRQATTDAGTIHVATSGGKVTLTGNASSWQSIEDAASAAWSAPGVTDVVDLVKRERTN